MTTLNICERGYQAEIVITFIQLGAAVTRNNGNFIV